MKAILLISLLTFIAILPSCSNAQEEDALMQSCTKFVESKKSTQTAHNICACSIEAIKSDQKLQKAFTKDPNFKKTLYKNMANNWQYNNKSSNTPMSEADSTQIYINMNITFKCAKKTAK